MLRLAALLLLVLALCCDAVQAQAPVSILIQDDAGSIDFGLDHDVRLFRKDAVTLKTESTFEAAGVVTAEVSALAIEAERLDATTINIGSPPIDVLAALGRIYLGPAVINVGKDRAFKDIQSAWNLIKDKLLFTSLLIRVDSGTYDLRETLEFRNHPTPHLITIRGDTVTPSNVVLNATAPDTSVVIFRGVGSAGITFQGFLLVGSFKVGGNVCLGAYDSAQVAAHAIEVRGCWYGLFALSSKIVAPLVKITAHFGIMAPRGSVEAEGATLVGLSKLASKAIFVSFDGVVDYHQASFRAFDTAVYCEEGGKAMALEASFDNVALRLNGRNCMQACGPFGSNGATACVSGTQVVPNPS